MKYRTNINEESSNCHINSNENGRNESTTLIRHERLKVFLNPLLSLKKRKQVFPVFHRWATLRLGQLDRPHI